MRAGEWDGGRTRDRIRRCWSGGGFLVALLFFCVAPALAEEPAPRKLDLSAAVRYGFPVGNEESGLKWSDLYDPAIGGAIEFSYRATPRVAFHAGAAYDRYPASEVSLLTPAGTVAGRFNDQKLLTLYLGVRGYLLDMPLPERSGGVNPYLRADLGATQFNGANFNGLPSANRSRSFAFSVGFGADILTYTNFIVFFETRYEDHGTPDQAKGSFRALPVSMGVRLLL